MRSPATLAALLLCLAHPTIGCAEDLSVEQVLERWQTAVSNVAVYEASFKRLVYDDVFRVRNDAIGEVWLEGPRAGRLAVRPDQVPGDPQQRKLKLGDTVYKVRADRAEIWEWNSDRLKHTDPETGMSEENPFSKEPGSEQARQSWFWMFDPTTLVGSFRIVLGLEPRRLGEECDLALPPESRVEVIALTATPRSGSELARQFERIDVQLDKHTYLPRAVRIIDPAGNLETVYSYSDVRVTSLDEAPP
jgi:hypothetical protein